MRYVPYGPELSSQAHVLIGGTPLPSAALLASNQPGVRLPPALRADTNTEIALNLLRGPSTNLPSVEAVSAERFDVDALLAVWALSDPAGALARAERATLAARAGAFGVQRSEAAAWFVCWVNGVRDEQRLDSDAACFEVMLPLVASVLDAPRDYDLLWIGEYSDIIVANSMLNSGAVEIEEHPALDLSVMHTPLDLHDLTRHTATRGSRLLTVRSENTYTLEYRLESWVQYQSRRPLPRIDLRPLAARLGLFERAPGAWRAEPVEAPIARLFLDAGNGRPAPSAIDAETVVAEVLDFLRAGATRPELHWSPYGPPAGAP